MLIDIISKSRTDTGVGCAKILGAIIVTLITIFIFHSGSVWLEKMRWLFDGPQLLSRKYKRGVPFMIATPGRRYTVVSSPNHIKELATAKEAQLSLVATAEEVFQPHYTMNGVELNRLDLQHRILRSLASNLPSMQSTLTLLANEALSRELDRKVPINGWKSVGIFHLTQNVIAQANCYTFYGEEMSRKTDFIKAAIQYPQDVFIAAEALRCSPRAFAPVVSWLVTRGHWASKHLMKCLLPMIRTRMGEPPPSFHRPLDYIDHILHLYPEDISDRAPKMVQQTLALWFAGVHQPAITLFYALIDLCTYTEYQTQLYDEIQSNINEHGHLNISKLSLLDSFLKESARLNASESISLRRKALGAYRFQDGTQVADGDWVCIPQRAIMRDPTIYPEGDKFIARRFVESEGTKGLKRASRYTDLDAHFSFWGLGKQACPGRFYASFIIKIALAEIIQHYDIRLQSVKECRTFCWRSSILPLFTSKFDMRLKPEKQP